MAKRRTPAPPEASDNPPSADRATSAASPKTKRLSVHPLSPDDALRAAMGTKPPPGGWPWNKVKKGKKPS